MGKGQLTKTIASAVNHCPKMDANSFQFEQTADAVLHCAAALLYFVHDLLEPRSNRRAIAPAIDDLQSLFEKRERTIDGQVFRRIVGALAGCRHRRSPPSRTTQPRLLRVNVLIS